MVVVGCECEMEMVRIEGGFIYVSGGRGGVVAWLEWFVSSRRSNSIV